MSDDGFTDERRARIRLNVSKRVDQDMLSNFRKVLGRRFDQAFHSIDFRSFRAALDRVGLPRGSTVCVHSALGSLGFVEGGPRTIIEALIDAVGREGCVAMPSYPTLGSMAKYLDTNPVFDVRHTPSKVGSLTELFRTWPGALRSAHPTNPLAAWGDGAEELLRDHECSPTPYGDETPFGRMARMDSSYILMIETPILSLLHHLQERANFPNYLLPGEREARIIDWEGRRRIVRTRLLRPKIPYYIAIPPQSGQGDPDWAILHDFALIATRTREKEIRHMKYRLGGWKPIAERRAALANAGHFASTRLGKGEVALLRIKPFMEIVTPELEALVERFRPCYELERLEKVDLPVYS